MQEKGLIVINKISTCSASSLLGLLFLIDKVELFENTLYELSVTSFKKNRHVIFDDESLANIFNIIEKELPENVLSIVNNRLFITYYDVIETGTKIDSTVLNWIILWALRENINLLYHVGGEAHCLGSEHFYNEIIKVTN
jgi:hypothetical protein